jgi:XRE family aerobic/anaerobic benzoate catabolism transcriptional regulator
MTRGDTLPDSQAEEAYLERLGQRVRGERMRRGMTRKQLAAESGVSERYLAQLEAGRGNISILLLRQVAQAMGRPLDLLVLDGPERPVEAELLRGLLARLDPERLAEAHDLLSERFGLANAQARNGRIALIGLRGAGKSTLGRLLAERLALPFVEMTREIEAAAGMQMTEIIGLGGQTMLRRLALRALDAVVARHPTAVLATGGGLVAEPETYEALLANCFTVWVTARPEEHMSRVLAQGDRRPMADNPEAMEDLRRILAEREALYAKADRRLDTAGLTVAQALEKLLALLPR